MPMKLAIRTSGSPAELVPTIRRVIAETEPGVALASAAPFRTFLEGPLAQPRLNALLLGVFAGSAVVLAAVGLTALPAKTPSSSAFSRGWARGPGGNAPDGARGAAATGRAAAGAL